MIKRLAKSKDEVSMAILTHNYNEEITHVGAGVRWLRWLCDANGQDAVSTYHALVRERYPGNIRPPFNDEARLAAGMTPEWYEPLAPP